MSLLNELKRRHVFRVAITYIVVTWLILQVADVLLDKIGVPDWTFMVVLVILVIGFPVAVMLAWAYDMTPTGLQRTDAHDESASRSIGDTPPKIVGEPYRASVDALLKARDIGDPGVSQIIIDPLIDALRDDPRFMSLVAEVKRDVTRD